VLKPFRDSGEGRKKVVRGGGDGGHKGNGDWWEALGPEY